MNEFLSAVAVALISGGLALVGTIIVNRKDNAETLAKIRQDSAVANAQINGRIEVIQQEINGKMDVVQHDIKDLTRQVEKHNQVIERTYGLEQRMAVAEARIDELRDDAK